MRIAFVVLAAFAVSPAFAQVYLANYTDKNGYFDMQKLTCARLAGTFQEDADMPAA